MMPALQSAFGFIGIFLIAWLLSENRRSVPWRIVASGALLQKRGQHYLQQRTGGHDAPGHGAAVLRQQPGNQEDADETESALQSRHHLRLRGASSAARWLPVPNLQE